MNDINVEQRIPGVTKDLLIALVVQNGGKVTMKVADVDAVGGKILLIGVDQEKREITLEVTEDQP